MCLMFIEWQRTDAMRVGRDSPECECVWTDVPWPCPRSTNGQIRKYANTWIYDYEYYIIGCARQYHISHSYVSDGQLCGQWRAFTPIGGKRFGKSLTGNRTVSQRSHTLALSSYTHKHTHKHTFSVRRNTRLRDTHCNGSRSPDKTSTKNSIYAARQAVNDFVDTNTFSTKAKRAMKERKSTREKSVNISFALSATHAPRDNSREHVRMPSDVTHDMLRHFAAFRWIYLLRVALESTGDCRRSRRFIRLNQCGTIQWMRILLDAFHRSSYLVDFDEIC